MTADTEKDTIDRMVRGAAFLVRLRTLRAHAKQVGDGELVAICDFALEDPTPANPFAIGVAKLILHLISAP